jgi:hypothetical protein
MGLLTKEAILAAQDLKDELVAVPEWGGEVRVRAMNGTARDAYEISLQDPGQPGLPRLDNVRARLLAYTIVDEAGALLFTEADIEALGKKGAAAMDRVFEVACSLNGLRKQDIEALAGN